MHTADNNLEDKIRNMIVYHSNMCKNNPNNPKPIVDFGIFYTQLGKHTHAIELFKKALNINNNDYSIYRLIGLSYIKIKNYYATRKSWRTRRQNLEFT